MDDHAHPDFCASHGSSSQHFSPPSFEQYPPVDAVTAWTSSTAPGPSHSHHPSHQATWPPGTYAPEHDGAPYPTQPAYNYAEAPYDFAEYPSIPYTSDDPRSYQLPLYPPQPAYSQQASLNYYYSSEAASLSPTTESTLSPSDSYSVSSHFSSLSDFEDASVDAFPYLTPPPNNSTYSELSHALDEPTLPPPPVLPLTTAPCKSEPLHPADSDDPPMGFLRPESPSADVGPPDASIVEASGSELDRDSISEPVHSPAPMHPQSEPNPAATSDAASQSIGDSKVVSSPSTSTSRTLTRLSSIDSDRAPPSPLNISAALSPSGSTTLTSTASLQEAPASSQVAQKKRSKPSSSTRALDDAESVKRRKKPALACLFCRERKIACGPPPDSAEDKRCNQCVKRSRECEMPTESRRGQYQRRKAKERAAMHTPELPSTSENVPTFTIVEEDLPTP